jgi:hypothetical protein
VLAGLEQLNKEHVIVLAFRLKYRRKLLDIDILVVWWYCMQANLQTNTIQKLNFISFRSGYIRTPSGLTHLANSLRVLELYENRLRTLDGIQVRETV